MANAPVLKTGVRKDLGVRIPRPPSPRVVLERRPHLETGNTMPAMLLLAVVSLLLGCGKEATTPTSVVGTYGLSAFNAQSLPYRRDLGPNAYVTTISMTLSVNAGGSWAVTETNEFVNGSSRSVTSYTDIGTWTMSGSSVALVIPPGQPCGFGATCTVESRVSGTWAGNTLTLVPEGAMGPAPIAAYKATLVFTRN